MNQILSEFGARKWLDQGRNKYVFEIHSNPNLVLKVQIVPVDDLNARLREPVGMMSLRYCNRPHSVTVYVSKRKRHRTKASPNYIRTVDRDFGQYAILCWLEPRAIRTGVHDTLFLRESVPYLETNGFTDLSERNVGVFRIDENRFENRWIDLQTRRDVPIPQWFVNGNLTFDKSSPKKQ